MENNFENDEIVFNFNKVSKVMLYRKQWILLCFALIIIFVLLLTLTINKKYTSDANLYINKANTTNLAEINPFMISDMGGSSGMSSLLKGGGANLDNEIEIIKSPLVMADVIKQNNIKYTKGKRKGEYLSVEGFLKDNISISIKKGTNVINISYKTQDRELAYNVVNSIILNYQRVNEEMNLKKAVNDKKLLESTYDDTSKSLNQKLSAMKRTGGSLPVASVGNLAAMRGYNKALSSALGGMASQAVESQKSQIAVDQEVDKLKMIKTKLEWSTLVEEMSKNATNIIVLKQPELKRDFEYSEPKLVTNIILGLIMAFFASIISVIVLESNDKKLTYSALGENISYNEDDLSGLKLVIASKSDTSFALINFTEQYVGLEKFGNIKYAAASKIPEVINNIKKSDKIIFAGKIGQTPKKSYNQIKNLCKELNKEIIREVLV